MFYEEVIEASLPMVLGGYELIERVGRGGMASLYLARRAGARGFVRPVAVKVVHAHLLEDSNFVEMFIDEANVCSRLSHPNLVHVEELVEADGALFLVMEFVEGCSLGKLLNHARRQRQRLPVPLVVHMIAKAADGLHAAHEIRGDYDEPLELVHRDVSPSNLLLSRRGNLKIIDFGIAKFSSRQHHTRAQKLKGKVAYMSPEQINREDVDRRSDIYSLGVVLWETLANRRAYRAKDDVALLQQVMTRAIPPIESLRDDLPDELIATLEQALAPDPSARFETAHEMWHSLMAAVPEASLVTSKDVGEYVRRVLEADGDSSTSHQRVRSTTLTGASSEDTIAIVEDSSSVVGYSREVAASTHPGTSTDRALLIGVLLAGIAAVVLLTIALWPREPTPVVPVAAPAPIPAEAIPEPAPPPVKVATPPPAPTPAPAPEPEEVAEDETDEVEEDVRPRRSRRRARRRAAARRAEPVSNPQAVPTWLVEEESSTPPPASKTRSRTKVDDVILADQDDLDRAAISSDSKAKKKAESVEQDGALLADDYQ